jgi:Protein of unknown function (DUF3887)
MDSLQYGPPPPTPIAKPPDSSRRQLFIGLGIAAGALVLGVLVVIVVAGMRLMVGAFQEPSKAMTTYTDALIRKDYQGAYKMASPELRAATSFADLVQLHNKLFDQFGALKTVKQTYWHIETKNGMNCSTIQARFQFERASQMFEFELHEENGSWHVFSYKQL